MPARKGLGEVLLEEGLADQAALAVAQRAARRLGCALVVALMDEHLVEPRELFDALRRRLKLPAIDLDRIVVDPEAVRQVPHDLAERHCLLPFALERRAARSVIRVAMADPLDHAAIEEIQFSTGYQVEPALTPATDVAAAVPAHYRGVVTKIIPREQQPLPQSLRPVTAPPPALGGTTSASATQPVHRLEDEAPPEMRLRALLNALVRRGLITEEEYLEELRDLLKQTVAPDE